MDNNYISLACEYIELDSKTKNFVSKSEYGENDGGIDGYVDTWLHDHRKEHLSILGEFGTGKTWFSLHYAWRLLQDYLKAKENKLPRPRIPIFIPLRDFSKAMEVEALISDFFFRKHKIDIQGVFPAFNQLNKMGKVLLIFDGFDEMSDRVDKQKMIDNFWQLATIITGKSKVILTCRNKHFPQIKEGRQLLNAELKMTTKHLTDTAPQFEVVQLLRFDLQQIRKLLLLHTNEETVEQIMAHDELTDLLSRPIMTELVFDALDDIEQGKPIDMSRVYLYATRRKMERDIKQGRTFTSLADKLYFLCELSWQMLSSNKLVISYKEFPDIIRSLFIYIEDKDIDYWRNDLRSQSMLVIDEEDGNYKPAHKSLLEFFVAFKFAAHLGILSVDFTDVAKSQSHVDNGLEALDYSWEEYFVRDINSDGEVVPISPLRSFKTSSFEKLFTLVGNAPFTRAITDLMMGMISWEEEDTQKTLLSIIESCKDKTFEEVGYLVSNIILILLEYKHDFFKSKDLSNLCLRNFRFPVPEYTRNDYRKNRMRYIDKFADVSGTNFENSDLCKADLGQSWLENKNIYFQETNFINAKLDDFKLHRIQLNEICIIESKNLAVLTSINGLIILNIDTFKAEKRINDPESGFHILISSNEKYIFQSIYGGVKILDSETFDIVYKHKLSSQYNPDTSEPNNLWTLCFSFMPTSNMLIVGCANSFIYIIDLNEKKEVNILSSSNSAHNLSVSPCEKFLVSSGFHEFILWETKNFQKIKFEQSEKLKRYIARFHPIKSEFVLLYENHLRFFDTSLMNFFHELYLDENHWSGCIAFSKDGDKLFIAQDTQIYIIDYHQKSIIQTIELSEDEFDPWSDTSEEIYRKSAIEDIAVDSTSRTLYLVHDNRCVTKVDVSTGEIVNIYYSLQDFTGADFTGAKGLNKAVMEQLYKNGAIVEM